MKKDEVMKAKDILDEIEMIEFCESIKLHFNHYLNGVYSLKELRYYIQLTMKNTLL